MIDLSAFQGTVWLAEPTRFQQCVSRVLNAGRCFTREEILAAHKADLERAKAIADEAIPSCGEVFDATEAAIHDDAAPRKTVVVPMRQLSDDEIATMRAEWEQIHREPRAKEDIEVLSAGMTYAAAPKAIRAVKGKVGVIGIYGPVGQHRSSELAKAGGTSLDFVNAAFDRLIADPSIGAIVLHMDSPGGESFGVEELSAKIYNARSEKPIYAIADSVAASAAYWIATAAGMMICTPGGLVGSVGVYVMHVDQSEALAKEGFKVTLVSAGKYKTELAPFAPLSDEAKANQQRYVDELHMKFIKALGKNRGVAPEHVRNSFGQGRVMTADEGLAAGMIDRILTMDQLMGKLTGNSVTAGGAGRASAEMSAFMLKLKQEQRRRSA